ncbi:MAG TPA: S41 family peptidase [Ferruginibacter sp.]|nr:S41 family peptidase [Ferruginibacter sp.]
MNKYAGACLGMIIVLFFSCSTGKNGYSPVKKYPAAVLRNDYILLKEVLENKHPSLYWYTGKDSMDLYFSRYYDEIKDSMTEQQFAWHIVAPLIDKIHCGHTSVSMSKGFVKWADKKRFPSFPLFIKVWNDTMAVTGNLNQQDSVFKRGTLITSVNGVRNSLQVTRMFNYLPEDGKANNVNFIRLSANFPYYHRNIYGLSKTYIVTYLDSNNRERTASIPVYTPPKDSVIKDSLAKVDRKKLPRLRSSFQYRSLVIDSTGTSAVMTLNTFSKGHLRKFFRRSFKKLTDKNIDNLILDIRSNGGGRVGLSTLLTRYISRYSFKVADSLYAVSRSLNPFTKYIKGNFLNNIELAIISRKKADGLYHLRHLENKLYTPRRNIGYKGDVYVLINGPTFSAAALFCNAIKGQPGILLIGEETGGGWHGNNGIMIPDITLPNTKIRVRLPLFRLVQYNHIPKTGTGIIPDIYIGTSYDALIKGYDKKMQVVKDLIRIKSTGQTPL